MLLSSSPHTVAPPPTKRKMRMYADDIEEEKSKRLVFSFILGSYGFPNVLELNPMAQLSAESMQTHVGRQSSARSSSAGRQEPSNPPPT